MANELNDLKGFVLMTLLFLPVIVSTNINCNGKAFHCVDSAHFMICVDLGGGVSSTIDDFVIPCPPTTECHESNIFECDFPKNTVIPLEVIGVAKISDISETPSLIDSATTYRTATTRSIVQENITTDNSVTIQKVISTQTTEEPDLLTVGTETVNILDLNAVLNNTTLNDSNINATKANFNQNNIKSYNSSDAIKNVYAGRIVDDKIVDLSDRLQSNNTLEGLLDAAEYSTDNMLSVVSSTIVAPTNVIDIDQGLDIVNFNLISVNTTNHAPQIKIDTNTEVYKSLDQIDLVTETKTLENLPKDMPILAATTEIQQQVTEPILNLVAENNVSTEKYFEQTNLSNNTVEEVTTLDVPIGIQNTTDTLILNNINDSAASSLTETVGFSNNITNPNVFNSSTNKSVSDEILQTNASKRNFDTPVFSTDVPVTTSLNDNDQINPLTTLNIETKNNIKSQGHSLSFPNTSYNTDFIDDRSVTTENYIKITDNKKLINKSNLEETNETIVLNNKVFVDISNSSVPILSLNQDSAKKTFGKIADYRSTPASVTETVLFSDIDTNKPKNTKNNVETLNHTDTYEMTTSHNINVSDSANFDTVKNAVNNFTDIPTFKNPIRETDIQYSDSVTNIPITTSDKSDDSPVVVLSHTTSIIENSNPIHLQELTTVTHMDRSESTKKMIDVAKKDQVSFVLNNTETRGHQINGTDVTLSVTATETTTKKSETKSTKSLTIEMVTTVKYVDTAVFIGNTDSSVNYSKPEISSTISTTEKTNEISGDISNNIVNNTNSSASIKNVNDVGTTSTEKSLNTINELNNTLAIIQTTDSYNNSATDFDIGILMANNDKNIKSENNDIFKDVKTDSDNSMKIKELYIQPITTERPPQKDISPFSDVPIIDSTTLDHSDNIKATENLVTVQGIQQKPITLTYSNFNDDNKTKKNENNIEVVENQTKMSTTITANPNSDPTLTETNNSKSQAVISQNNEPNDASQLTSPKTSSTDYSKDKTIVTSSVPDTHKEKVFDTEPTSTIQHIVPNKQEDSKLYNLIRKTTKSVLVDNTENNIALVTTTKIPSPVEASTPDLVIETNPITVTENNILIISQTDTTERLTQTTFNNNVPLLQKQTETNSILSDFTTEPDTNILTTVSTQSSLSNSDNIAKTIQLLSTTSSYIPENDNFATKESEVQNPNTPHKDVINTLPRPLNKDKEISFSLPTQTENAYTIEGINLNKENLVSQNPTESENTILNINEINNVESQTPTIATTARIKKEEVVSTGAIKEYTQTQSNFATTEKTDIDAPETTLQKEDSINIKQTTLKNNINVENKVQYSPIQITTATPILETANTLEKQNTSLIPDKTNTPTENKTSDSKLNYSTQLPSTFTNANEGNLKESDTNFKSITILETNTNTDKPSSLQDISFVTTKATAAQADVDIVKSIIKYEVKVSETTTASSQSAASVKHTNNLPVTENANDILLINNTISATNNKINNSEILNETVNSNIIEVTTSFTTIKPTVTTNTLTEDSTNSKHASVSTSTSKFNLMAPILKVNQSEIDIINIMGTEKINAFGYEDELGKLVSVNNADLSSQIIKQIDQQVETPSNDSKVFINKELEFDKQVLQNSTMSPNLSKQKENSNYLEQQIKSTNNIITPITPSSINVTDTQSNKHVTAIKGANTTYLKSTKNKANETHIPTTVFDCTNRTRGKYADNTDCRKFYICIGKSHPVIGICPNNTVFSEINKQCTRNLSHCVRNNQFRCLLEGRFSDFLRDNIYYICVKNSQNAFIRYRLQCQKGYHLNKNNVKCENNVDDVNQSYSSVSDVTSTNAPTKAEIKTKTKVNKSYVCEKEGKIPHKDDCNKYYVCSKTSKGEYRLKINKCASGEIYDKKKKNCVDSDSNEC